MVTLIITEAEYVALSTCTQEVKCVNILLETFTKLMKPSVI